MSAEIVLIMGYNAAGKTTLVQNFVEQGYTRINRDEIGGKLKDLHQYAEKAIQEGHNRLVLDNTYRNRESRKSIIQVAKKHGLPIRCLHLNTSFEDAQYNACQRMIRDTGKLLMPDDLKLTKNPNHFPPAALFGYRKEFEKPTSGEGFSKVETINFERKPTGYTNKSLILDYDGNLRDSLGEHDYPTKISEIKLLPGRKERIQEYVDQGFILTGVSNQSGVSKDILSYQDAVDCFEHTNDLLGHKIDYYFCPHSVPPVKCYCRKPHPGLGVMLIEKYKLDPAQCIFVGDQTTDKTFAERCGFQFIHTDEFFK